MKIINLTPHDIHVLSIDGGTRVIKKSGKSARVYQDRQVYKVEGKIPFTVTKFGEVKNLPEPRENTI